jgi:hypothetical protein
LAPGGLERRSGVSGLLGFIERGSQKGVGGETHVERLPQAIVDQYTGANVSGGPITITSFQSDSQDLQYANQIRQEMPDV